MKRTIILLVLGLFVFQNPIFAVKPTVPTSTMDAVQIEATASEQKRQKKLDRRQAKLEKRINKFRKKMDTKGIAQGAGIWDDDTFRLGAIIALGGLLLRLLSFIPLLGGILSLIGFLILLLGIGIMIWVLINR